MSVDVPLHGPEPLDKTYDLAGFGCGVQALDNYLRKYAYLNHQNRSARTYVVARGLRVIGYYTLAAGSVAPETAPPRVARGLGRYPLPVTLLARLAVDVAEQGRGLGAALLKDAVLRTAQAADIVGSRALLVHAKDDRAKDFYRKFGLEPSPVDDLQLYLLMKDIKRVLGAAP